MKLLLLILLTSLFSILRNQCSAQTLLENNNAHLKDARTVVPQARMINYDSLSNANYSLNIQSTLPQPTTAQIESVSKSTDTLRLTIENLNSSFRRFMNSQDSIVKKVAEAEKRARLLKIVNDSLEKVITALQQQLSLANINNAVLRHKTHLHQIISTDSSIRIKNNNIRRNIWRSIELIKSNPLKIDSTRYISNLGEYVDSSIDVTVQLMDLEELRQEKADTLSELKTAYLIYSQELFKSRPDTTTTSTGYNLSEKYRTLEGTFKEIEQRLIDQINTWNRLVGKYVKTKSTNNTNKADISALPYINTISDIRDVNANLNVIGNNVPNNKDGLYTEFGLYTKILSSKDSASPYQLFINDIGNYGIFFKTNIGFMSVADTNFRKLGFNMNISYLSKPVNKDTLKGIPNNFSTSTIHTRFGFELAFYKNLLSIYTNINVLSFVTNNDELKLKYSFNKDILGYYDWGVRMLLNPQAASKIDANLKLYADFNFLVNSRTLKTFAPNNNSVLIPNFRIGLRTKLGAL